MAAAHNPLQKNADRFTGFADVYDRARPTVPHQPIAVLCGYLGRRPDVVVDLGSGTGLSARAWEGRCGRVIGVEPSADMLRVANEKAGAAISFVQAFANDTGLPAASADIVVCSQSFHWMEPVSTLREADRLLKDGGVFAAIDCDWPPVTRWQAEEAYMALYGKAKQLEQTLPAVRESFVRYDKNNHLENIRQSGYFRYCREIVFSNTERCTARRLVELLLSQGSLQAVRRHAPGPIETAIAQFSRRMEEIYGDGAFDIDFCYRMRVGIKQTLLDL